MRLALIGRIEIVAGWENRVLSFITLQAKYL